VEIKDVWSYMPIIQNQQRHLTEVLPHHMGVRSLLLDFHQLFRKISQEVAEQYKLYFSHKTKFRCCM